MKSLDLSNHRRTEHFSEVLNGVVLALEGGKLRVSSGTEMSAFLVDEAFLNDVAAHACRGVPDGLYTARAVVDADTVRPVPKVNPFARETYSLTEVMRLRREDPDMAQRCESAARG